MSTQVQHIRFRVRGRTAAAWTASNEVLLERELGLEVDTRKFKFGTGVTPWNALEYAGGGAGGGGSEWHSGAGAPAAVLGADGDFYLRTSNGDVYEKDAGAWAVVGNLTGPPGAPGAPGSVWRSGAGAPANSLGANGDYYLRTSNGDAYQKSGGSYSIVTNLRGPEGPASTVPGPPGPSSSTFPTASFDGGLGAIQAGSFCDLYIPFGFEITGFTLLAGIAASIVIDVRVADFASFPPQASDSICGGNPPSLVSADKRIDTTLAGWETEIPSGSTIRFVVVSCISVRRANLVLQGFRT